MDMCMFWGCCDAIILWIRWHLGSEPQFFMQTIWNSNDCSDHGQYYFFIVIKAYVLISQPRANGYKSTNHWLQSWCFKWKTPKEFNQGRQDASCHHIRQMYKGMIAYISPLGNSWWLFKKIEKSKGHEKSWDLRRGYAISWLDEMSLKIQNLNVAVTGSAVIMWQHA